MLAGAASEGLKIPSAFRLVVVLALFGCKGAWNQQPPKPEGVTGVWTGSQGPFKDQMRPTARLELTEDGGVVTGYWYSSEFVDGGFDPVGALHGFRDGGVLILRDLASDVDGGFPFTGSLVSETHLEATEVRIRSDGGPLPVYLKLDRTP